MYQVWLTSRILKNISIKRLAARWKVTQNCWLNLHLASFNKLVKETAPQEEVCSKMLLATLFLFCACWLHVRTETVSTKYGDIDGLVTSYPNASGRRSNPSANFSLAFLSPLHQLESYDIFIKPKCVVKTANRIDRQQMNYTCFCRKKCGLSWEKKNIVLWTDFRSCHSIWLKVGKFLNSLRLKECDNKTWIS